MRLAKWAVLWMALVALACAPALAQGANDNRDVNVQYVDCSQVQSAVGGQYGNATAIGRDAAAEVAQDLNITQNQVNACLGQIGQNPGGNGGDNNNNDDDDDNNNNDDDGTTNGDDDGVASDENNVIESSIPETKVLPNTGGPSLLALGAGLALVAGAASLIRLRR
jgi:LPXTG-motif cell wall-anchored protein